MVKRASELAINSHWAYRAKKGAPPQEVRVMKLGVKHPHRAYVAFVAMKEEGEETWAPSAGSNAVWEDLAQFQEIEGEMGGDSERVSPRI